MSLQVVEWASAWPMVLPYFDASVPAGFPSPTEDYLEAPLDLHDFLINNKAATFLMRVDGDSMRDAGIIDGDLLSWTVPRKPTTAALSSWPSTGSTRRNACGVDRTAYGSNRRTLSTKRSRFHW